MKLVKILKEIWSYLVIIIVVLLVRTFIITPVNVDGDSMYPTLKDKEILLLKKYDKTIERFDIVVFRYGNTKYIKRVIGLPGEHIEYKNNELYINYEKIEDVKLFTATDNFMLEDLGLSVIPENMYFVIGDNRVNSQDSRVIGLVSKEDIEGITTFRIFPFNKIGSFN